MTSKRESVDISRGMKNPVYQIKVNGTYYCRKEHYLKLEEKYKKLRECVELVNIELAKANKGNPIILEALRLSCGQCLKELGEK